MQFEWDQEKAERNLKKHGVSLKEAATVWEDLFNVELVDHDHSTVEQRFLMVGESVEGRFLLISFTERGNKVRITIARQLTPRGRRVYEHGDFE